MAEFRLLTKDNQGPLMRIQTTEAQRAFVAPNAVTMAQSLFEPGAEIFGLWEGEAAVGMMAVIDLRADGADQHYGRSPQSLYVWRLMIAADQQGKGYGTQAIEYAKGLAKARGRNEIILSVVDEPGSGIPFYEKLGLIKTGRIVDEEVEMACSVQD